MPGVLLEFFIVLVLVALNGFFSMAEIALLSCRRTRIRELAAQGDARAAIVLELIQDRPRLLSTVQAGVSLVGIATGALGGTALAGRLAEVLVRVGIPSWLASTASFLLMVFLVTYLSVIVGELIPKQIALADGEGTALRLARAIMALSRVLAPAAGALSRSSSALLRFLHVTLPPPARVGREEIRVLIDEGVEGGRLRPGEGHLVREAVNFTEKRVSELMTPRAQVVWLERDAPEEVARRHLAQTTHSRFPVCDGGLDVVVGVIRAKDILDDRDRPDVGRLMTPPLFVPMHALAPGALESMRAQKSDLALAVDEYGIVQGLVTIHDILRGLVGDGHAPHDPAEGLAVRHVDGSWILDGLLETSRLAEIVAGEIPSVDNCRTLGGLIMSGLGRVPRPEDELVLGDLRLKVLTMVDKRVGKVRLRRSADPSADSE